MVQRGQQILWARTAPAPPMPWRERRKTLLVRHVLPLTLYVGIALLVTYPLILHFGTAIPSDGAQDAQNNDALLNYWNNWWIWRALSTGQNPFFTPLLYAPEGVPLYLHTLSLFNGLLSIPLQLTFGLTVAYNVVALLSLVLAGYFAYLLSAHISGNHLASFVAGASYAFGSYHLLHLLGHANLIASEWLPAYILCLFIATESSGRRRTLAMLGAVGTLLLLMLCDWQYVIFAILFTVLFVCWHTLAQRTLVPLVVAAVIGVVWLFFALPLLLPTFREVQSGVVEQPLMFGQRGAETYSADFWSLFVPGPRHLWWGAWGQTLHSRFIAPAAEGVVFLGYLPLLLASAGAVLSWRRARFWLSSALFFFILALGPILHINGSWQFGSAKWKISLPFQLLGQFPGVSMMRVPIRFSLLVTLCIGVLVALGLTHLFARIERPGWQIVLTALLLSGVVAEQLTVPVPLETVPDAPFYRQLAASPEQGTIFEWPFSLKRRNSDYFQTIHGRPIFGGYIARQVAYPERALPPLGGIPAPNSDIFIHEAAPEIGNWLLAYSNVHWIVVYLNDSQLDREQLPTFLRQYAQPTPLYRDDQMQVYQPRPPSAAASFIGNGVPSLRWPKSDWLAQEERPGDGVKFRWFQSNAAIDAWSFAATPQTYALRFEAWSYHRPRRLEVRVDGQSIGQWQVQDLQQFDLPLTLSNGPHRIELHTTDPPTSPSSVGGDPRDTRPLAFAVAHVELRRTTP